MAMLDEVRASDVKNATTFAKFCQQNCGVPYATVNDIKALNKQAKTVFAEHPGTYWQTLVSVAQWCKMKKRRIGRVYEYVTQFRWAYKDGAIDLEGLRDESLERKIEGILFIETDQSWRDKVMRADGNTAKREVVAAWERANASVQKAANP